MRVHVRSEDPEVVDLCFDLLPHFAGRDLTITTGPVPTSDKFRADLYIWQLGQENFPDSELKVGEIEKYVFLIDREYLSKARPDVLKHPAVLLLKPVSQATLKMVIEHALERHCRDAREKTPVADRDDLLQCLLEANLQLQEYDQDRLRFLARAIHDFRAPLTSIGGYCGLFMSGDLGPLDANQNEVMRRMQRSVERLSRLVEAMLQLSMGRLVPAELKRKPASIHDSIQQSLHELKPLALEKRIAIKVDIEEPPQPLCFESQQIEQVIVNLLHNACKFTPKAGRIEVRGYPYWANRLGGKDGDAIGAPEQNAVNCYRVDIIDSGPGIPPDRASTMFEEYASYDGSGDRSGPGLGLAICKLILRLHQGRVWVESRPDGATFSFVLPLHYQEDRRGAEDSEVGDEVHCP